MSSNLSCETRAPAAPRPAFRNPLPRRLGLLALSVLAVNAVLTQPAAFAAVVTNWTVFNDHAPSGLTAANVTTYNLRGFPLAGDAPAVYPTSGSLTNFAGGGFDAGDGLPATLIASTRNTNPSLFPNAALGEPDPGTPAYDLFIPGGVRILDMANAGSSVGLAGYPTFTNNATATTAVGSEVVVLTFSNLNPGMRYMFRGTAVRKGVVFGGNHPGRWTYCKIEGADAFTDAHTPGCITSKTPLPAFTRSQTGVTYPAVNLAVGEVVFQSGLNTQGDLVGYDNINPGLDGTFSVIARGWGGVVTNRYLNMGADAVSTVGITITNAFDPIGYALTAIMLQEVGSDVLAIVSQPAPETSVDQLRPFALTSAASGSGLVSYQWYHAGSGAVPDATQPTYSVANAKLEDAGNYYVVASNDSGSTTSQVAHVTVIPDEIPPTVVSASSLAGNPFHGIVVRFNEVVNASLASQVASYQVTDAAMNEVAVNSATASADGLSAVLTVGPMEPGTPYTVTLTALEDLAENAIAGPVSVNFTTWPISRGFIQFDYFDGIGGVAVAPLVADPRYPNSPVATYFLSRFDMIEIFPDSSHENYGMHVTGFFIPPVSGNYIFRLASDDASQLYLNPTGDDPAGKVLIQEETTCCHGFNDLVSTPQGPLVAGERYYLEAIFKEGIGGDYLRVGVQLENEAFSGVAIPSQYLGVAVDPTGKPAITFTQQPASQTNAVNSRFVFTVEASNAGGLPQFYVWRKDGQEIPFANSPTYTTPPLGLADDESVYDCLVSIPGNAQLSAPAKVTITPDTTPPHVVYVRAAQDPTKLIVSFNELMSANGIDNSFFIVDGGSVAVVTAELDATGTNIVLTLGAPLPYGGAFTISIRDVTDAAGNAVEGTETTVQTFVLSRGFAKQEFYFNIGGGLLVSDLTSNPKYPDHPDLVQYATSLEGALNTYDNYGMRISGWIRPPEEGGYNFWMCSDDGGEFYLSTDSTPQEKVLIAREPQWNATQQYQVADRRTAGALENASTTLFPGGIQMTTEDTYYFELLMKEGGGGDNASAAWQTPEGPEPQNGSAPISGAYLAVLADPYGASVTITQQPQSQMAVIRSAIPPAWNFSQGPGDFTVVNPTASGAQPLAPWGYNTSSLTWTNGGQDSPAGIPHVSLLNSPTVTLTAGGNLMLAFTHRYSWEDGRPGDATPYDGGQVRISVNGGPYTPVPAANFTANGYNVVVQGDFYLKGQDGFGFSSPDYATGELITSEAMLGSFAPGDTVSVQFVASWDYATGGANPNWEIANVEFDLGIAKMPPIVSFSVGAEATIDGGPSPYLAYQWQREIGGNFTDILGANSSVYSQAVGVADDGAQFRCLVFGVGASATSSVATVTITVPLVIREEGGNQIISWPDTDPLIFNLQSAPALLDPIGNTIWSPVLPAPVTVGDSKVVTKPLPKTGNLIYRLDRP